MNNLNFQNCVSFCNNFQNPTAILNSNLDCMYCNKDSVIRVGQNLGVFIMEYVRLPITQSVKLKTMINNEMYCARITPLWDELFLAEFLNSKELFTLFECTSIDYSMFTMISSLYSKINELTLRINKLENQLKNCDYSYNQAEFSRISSLINSLSLYITHIKECISLFFDQIEQRPVDIFAITKAIIDRSNSKLASVDRSIYLIDNRIADFVASNFRHLVYIIASALQNALLYSPRNCIPVVALSSSLLDAKRYIILTIRNDSALFVNDKSGEAVDVEFSSQRLGLGIPMMKKFAEKYGGLFRMEKEGNSVLVEFRLPAYIPKGDELDRVECDGFEFGEYGDAEIIDLLMQDVINCYNFDES